MVLRLSVLPCYLAMFVTRIFSEKWGLPLFFPSGEVCAFCCIGTLMAHVFILLRCWASQAQRQPTLAQATLACCTPTKCCYEERTPIGINHRNRIPPHIGIGINAAVNAYDSALYRFNKSTNDIKSALNIHPFKTMNGNTSGITSSSIEVDL